MHANNAPTNNGAAQAGPTVPPTGSDTKEPDLGQNADLFCVRHVELFLEDTGEAIPAHHKTTLLRRVRSQADRCGWLDKVFVRQLFGLAFIKLVNNEDRYKAITAQELEEHGTF